MTQSALDFGVVTLGEDFMVKHLRAKGAFIYPVSDAFPLKERIRRAIVDGKFDYAIIGRNSATKKCETFAQCFERLYHESLEPTTAGKKRAQPKPA